MSSRGEGWRQWVGGWTKFEKIRVGNIKRYL